MNTSNYLAKYNDLMKENENIYRDLAKNFQLSECRLWILYVLRTEAKALSQSDICACLYQPKQSINSALKKLESEGYIILSPGNDRRSKQIMLTPAGIHLCEKTVDQIIETECNALSDLSDEGVELFLSLFHKYTELLKKHMQKIYPDGEYNENTII